MRYARTLVLVTLLALGAASAAQAFGPMGTPNGVQLH